MCDNTAQSPWREENVNYWFLNGDAAHMQNYNPKHSRLVSVFLDIFPPGYEGEWETALSLKLFAWEDFQN